MVGPLFMVFAVLSASRRCFQIQDFKSPVYGQAKTIGDRLTDLDEQRLYLTDTVANLSRTLDGLKSEDEKPAAKACPSGYTMGADMCFKFLSGRIEWANFDFGAAYCGVASGGRLAILNSEEKFALIRRVGYHAKNCLWVGANVAKDGQFTWQDGSKIREDFWLKGEPNNRAEHCVDLLHEDFKLNDEACGKKCRTVCEVPMV